MSGVRVQGLTVRLGGQDILRALDLEVEAGDFVVLLGPSGCGKSTLLNALAGLVDVSAGRIEIGGREVTHVDPSGRGIGMVFQSYALYPTMTVERNLSFGLRVAGASKTEVERRVQHVARMLQLEPLLQRKPAHLSGGQRQRVAIGRALVREASVFLLDEPLSNLDAQLRAELRREIKLLHQRLGTTMIHVTHDQAEALTLATRLVVMKDGVIEQVGTPAEVYASPRNLFVASFLGSPPINWFQGTLVGAQEGLRFESQSLSADLSALKVAGLQSGPCVWGVRPEHVHIRAQGHWAARVQLVESLGSHQVVWLEHQGLVLAALVHETSGYSPGETVRFDLEPPHLLCFDPVSGARLT
jgi:multiple sugar transport system ATP-binding protein